MNRIVKLAAAVAVAGGYCLGMGAVGYNFASAQGDGISEPFFGLYRHDGDTPVEYNLYLSGATEAMFEGLYTGSGIVVCNDLDPYTIVFTPSDFNLGQENFYFTFTKWSKFYGDHFVAQKGIIEIGGYIGADKEHDNRKRAIISGNEYIRR